MNKQETDVNDAMLYTSNLISGDKQIKLLELEKEKNRVSKHVNIKYTEDDAIAALQEQNMHQSGADLLKDEDEAP